MGFKGKEVLINSFAYADFNYCPLIWHFCSAKSVRTIEQIQIRTLRTLHHDFESDYKTLPDKSGKCTMEVKRLRTLELKICKTRNKLNPSFIEEIFHRLKWLTHRPINVRVNKGILLQNRYFFRGAMFWKQQLFRRANFLE